MFILAVTQLIQVPFFTAWRWFVKFEDGRADTQKLLMRDEEDIKRRYLPEQPWTLNPRGEEMDVKKAKEQEKKTRTKKTNNFKKKYQNPEKLINGVFEKGKNEEDDSVDVGD